VKRSVHGFLKAPLCLFFVVVVLWGLRHEHT
jgi:hypothetical protein